MLGAMEDLMIAHDGVLSEDVLERVKKGVLRKLGVACSSVTASQIDAVKEVLQHEPCALLELDLSDCKVDEKPCFEGMTLPQVLLPPTERLACWRLRSLQLSLTVSTCLSPAQHRHGAPVPSIAAVGESGCCPASWRLWRRCHRTSALEAPSR